MGLFKRKKKEEEKPKPAETAGEEVETPAAPAVKLPKGEDAESFRVVLKPHISEKGTVLEGVGKYIFKVAKGTNKPAIKKAIEKLYKVRVENVHILKMPSKFRQVGKYEGKKPGFKKAIVTLKEGDRIEVAH
jgi:large subunit ribosomal protein L23